jgi:hypothetical protein
VARFGQDELLLNWAKHMTDVFDACELDEPAS